MRSTSRFRAAHGTAGGLRTTRLALPFLLSGLACLTGQPAIGQTVTAAPVGPVDRLPLDDPFAAPIAEAAQRFRLPAIWIGAVLNAESGGDPLAISPKGAKGLMQIMPDTWAELHVRYGLGNDPFDPRDSILAGAGYLRDLLDRYGLPGFLAAYNAGPARYEDYLAGRPLPDETRAYLTALRPFFGDLPDTFPADSTSAIATRSWTTAPLFAGPAEGTSAAGPPPPARPSNDKPATVSVRDLSAILPQSDGLFVALSRQRPGQ
ncbi:MAG: lytic transglycosylase domain-containing protein [Telmatospirillum sp.]|nr:lytic transglycosylase domain-containing protein [Telmatospirillum sp.]